MVNRNEINTARSNNLTNNDAFSAAQFSAPRSLITSSADELIASLAKELENRRARQVGEWESMRRQSLPMPFRRSTPRQS